MKLLQRLRLKALFERKSLVADRRAATAVEYCLIAGVISVAVVGGAMTMGQKSNATFTTLSTKVWGS